MKKRTEFDFVKGELLLINKPLTWTSFDAVNKIRYMLQKQLGLHNLKVGHAGTLDPLATGLLIICTGKMTKQIDQHQAKEKEYTGTFTLGATTPSYDLETEPDTFYPIEHITFEQIKRTASDFICTSNQLPPVFSAKKVDGKRAYIKARKGEHVQVKTREITISAFEIIEINLPEIKFRIVCSKGTYIRSIAFDFGLALGSGAYLSQLCRTGIGEYRIEQSTTIDQFKTLIDDAIKLEKGNAVNSGIKNIIS
ncbi:MAG: tRNA pseudouridine(55) synthase TruB [Bacteroidetes bacterium]|nr:tRNA pseudouridine(55) synthase TruB [Bacteroidota bacterium]HET6243276.1 tRNA pseudouridine(55) synthase TruB [Bacteroidia bacterium]